MARLAKNARVAANARLITSPEQARKLCKGGAVGWQAARAAVLYDHSQPCHICFEPIRWDLKFPDPLSPSVDHLPGHRVEDQVGKTVGEARRILHDPDGMRPAHFGCNSRQNRNGNAAVIVPESQPLPKPRITASEYNRKCAAVEGMRDEYCKAFMALPPYDKLPHNESQAIAAEMLRKINEAWRAA